MDHPPTIQSRLEIIQDELPRGRGYSPRLQLIQRVSFYLLTGAILLIVLLLVAQSINPPDSALRDADMTRLLAPWDGAWTGKETVLTVSGTKLATYQSQREFWSTSSAIQTERIVRASDSGINVDETWVNKVMDDGTLTARSSRHSPAIQPFVGNFLEGSILWTRKAEWGTTTRRSWIASNTLHTEEYFFPTNKEEEPTITIGIFTRR